MQTKYGLRGPLLFYSLNILALSPGLWSPPQPQSHFWYPVGTGKKGASLGNQCGLAMVIIMGERVGLPASLAKDPVTEKGSLLLQSSLHHHLSAQTLSGENCAPQMPRYERRVGRGQEWGETLRRFSSGEEGPSLWKVEEGKVWKLASSPGCTFKSWSCHVPPPASPSVKWNAFLSVLGGWDISNLFFLHCPPPLCPRLELSSALASSGAVIISTPSPSVGCDQDPLDPVYLPAALELLDAPEYFRVQQVGRYPPANSSLGSRSETFLLLQPWPRAQPLLRASYPPFATQQVRREHQRLTPRLTGLRAEVCLCLAQRSPPAPAVLHVFQRGN